MLKKIILCLIVLQVLQLESSLSNIDPLTSPKVIQCSGSANSPIDYDCIKTQLEGDGIGGWVHAAVQDQFVFVFTWRHPNNFFINIQLPMSSKNPLVIEKLKTLKRHDRILVKGTVFKNDAPIEHLNVSEVEVVEAYTGLSEDYQYDANLPDAILNGSKLIGKVHATANDDKVLVIEVGDRVYPVFNKEPSLLKDLYRNDKIELEYFIPFTPSRPVHLEINTEASNPLKVLDRIVKGHNDPIHLKGSLVMYPKSPQIIFNVYAVRVEDSDGVKWDYTLINFEDIDLFNKFRESLEAAWNSLSAEAKYDRNKYINPKITVEVSGLKNVVSPGQANPQVFIKDIKDLKITFN